MLIHRVDFSMYVEKIGRKMHQVEKIVSYKGNKSFITLMCADPRSSDTRPASINLRNLKNSGLT